MQLFNYDNAVLSAGRDGKFGTLDDVPIRLTSATYNATTYTVTLTPVTPLGPGGLFRLRINRVITPVVGPGVADAAGNLLDGDGDGRAGGMYQTDIRTVVPPTTPAVQPKIVTTPSTIVLPTTPVVKPKTATPVPAKVVSPIAARTVIRWG